jgi:hypothetical protein
MSDRLFFFDDPAKQELGRAVASSWEFTPFAKFSKAKGRDGGIDCENYCEAWYFETGALPFLLDIPRSAQDYVQVAHNTRFLEFIRGRAEDPRSAIVAQIFREFPVVEKDFTTPPIFGDLFVGRNDSRLAREQGQGLWHLGIMLGPRKLTNCNALGVRLGNIDDPTYRRHLFAHFRPLFIPSHHH